MGRREFIQYVTGTNLEAAFEAAVKEAQYEYGHRGYTGTIAEKDGYGCAALTDELMTLDAATELAKRLLNDHDERCADSEMPACGIPVRVRGGERTYADLPVPVVSDKHPDWEAAAASAAVAGRLADGEIITSTSFSSYAVGRDGHVIADPGCRVSVTTVGSPNQTGWLFFGYAMW